MPITAQGNVDPESAYAGILERTLVAYSVTEEAAANLAAALGANAVECYRRVEAAEKELDRLDSEIDATVTATIAEVTHREARELLSCMKMAIDLERIGDLLSSVASCARALGYRIQADDMCDLVRIATLLERMLGDAKGGFSVHNVDRAIAVLRADSEVDRLRNLIMIRHLEQAASRVTQDSVQMLFMAQSLERAGDHVKNLAEEICHLATGRPVRHALMGKGRPAEQMYLEWLCAQHGLGERPSSEPRGGDRVQPRSGGIV
jgi:phosphate transport system protein